MNNEPAPALFLDRDGTIMVEVDHCHRPEDVALYPGVREAMLQAREAGYRLIVITNQSGIGRGYFSEHDLHRVNARLAELLGPAAPDGLYFCPDHPDRATHRRKPSPGMIEEACRDFPIRIEESWMIGDKAIDVQCGVNAGARGILVRTGYGDGHLAKVGDAPVHPDLPAAIRFILNGRD